MEKRNGLNKLATVKSGKTTVLEAFGPPNAITSGADSLAGAVYAISEVLTRGIEPDSMRGFLGSEFGYGVASTLRRENGECVNCGHITTARQALMLETTKDRAIQRMRAAWNK